MESGEGGREGRVSGEGREGGEGREIESGGVRPGARAVDAQEFVRAEQAQYEYVPRIPAGGSDKAQAGAASVSEITTALSAGATGMATGVLACALACSSWSSTNVVCACVYVCG